MLLFPNTRVELSNERPLLPGVTIDAEGSALIAGYSGGVFGVQEATGAAGDVFVGVSLSRPLSPATVPVMERLTVPAGGVVSLKAAALAGQTRVVRGSTGANLTIVGAAPAAGEAFPAANGLTIALNAALVGDYVFVTYVRSLTVAQAIMLQGNQDIGGPAGAYFGQVGVLTRGDVYTTEFDTLVDWSTSPSPVRLASSGRFTIGGTGAIVPGYVISPPTEGNAWLGLHISAN